MGQLQARRVAGQRQGGTAYQLLGRGSAVRRACHFLFAGPDRRGQGSHQSRYRNQGSLSSIGQVSAKAQVTDKLSVAGQYFYEWDYTRIPYGGTYFGAADPFFEGPDRLPVSEGFALRREKSRYGRDTANWGVMAKYDAQAIDSTVGVYYREFDDYQPWFAPEISTTSPSYRLAYARDVKLIGVSFSRVFNTVSFAGELSYRKDGALN